MGESRCEHRTVAQRNRAVHIGNGALFGGDIIFACDRGKSRKDRQIVDAADPQLALDHCTACNRQFFTRHAFFHQGHEFPRLLTSRRERADKSAAPWGNRRMT
jgi:hypothetical protein